MLRRVLIANRGEVVARVARTARRMNIETVGVYSDADRSAPWLRTVDTAVALGGNSPSESYLVAERIVAAAVATGADAVHPGYGFLAENADFAERVEASGLTFVGPRPESIRSMGSKLTAKRIARELGIPVLDEHAIGARPPTADELKRLGLVFPVLLKAGAGGGGMGIRRVDSAVDLSSALDLSQREARSAFGDESVYVERYLARARHIEVQVLGDGRGNAIHLFERECSIQRRHQKLIEESPAAGLAPLLRQSLLEAALAITRAIAYLGAGTVEFLVQDSSFFFIEMNTRLQVEHPVTEETTRTDLVELQFELAAGRPLPFAQEGLGSSGHSIEARLCAEVPEEGFRPATGLVAYFEAPSAPNVRYELGTATGHRVSPYYDSMIAKVIATGSNRDAARRTLTAALAGLTVHGVETNREYLMRIINSPGFANGEYDTTFVDRNPDLAHAPARGSAALTREAILALLGFTVDRRMRLSSLASILPGWRNVGSHRTRLELATAGTHLQLDYALDPGLNGTVWFEGYEHTVGLLDCQDHRIAAEVDGVVASARATLVDDRYNMSTSDADVVYRRLPRFPDGSGVGSHPGAVAPVPGLVVEVLVAPGDRVAEGDLVARLEAMKMIHEIRAPFDGIVVDVVASPGATVDAHTVLVVIEPQAETGSEPSRFSG